MRPNGSYLLPFPKGWYALGPSSELPRGGVLARRFMGQDIVLFRTQSGAPAAVDAYCPHMGAHFAYGGDVQGETIRCPFHSFRFDTGGMCVATGYGTKPPPKARLRSWPLCERSGALLVYYDAEGGAPQWNLPELDMSGWNAPIWKTWRLSSHPQETCENSVDIGHLAVVHGYDSVEKLADLRTEGPILQTHYAMTRPAGPLTVRSEFIIRIFGMGYSLVEVSIPRYGLQSRLFVMPQPTDPGQMILYTAVVVRKVTEPQRINPLLWVVPRPLLNAIVSRTIASGFAHDIAQDFAIWENKIYVHPAILAEGDGPIGKFRHWARQFYPAEAQS